jgi:hypothetical protein
MEFRATLQRISINLAGPEGSEDDLVSSLKVSLYTGPPTGCGRLYNPEFRNAASIAWRSPVLTMNTLPTAGSLRWRPALYAVKRPLNSKYQSDVCVLGSRWCARRHSSPTLCRLLISTTRSPSISSRRRSRNLLSVWFSKYHVRRSSVRAITASCRASTRDLTSPFRRSGCHITSSRALHVGCRPQRRVLQQARVLDLVGREVDAEPMLGAPGETVAEDVRGQTSEILPKCLPYVVEVRYRVRGLALDLSLEEAVSLVDT